MTIAMLKQMTETRNGKGNEKLEITAHSTFINGW